jgi:ferredoxin/flavodoxin---NADP+ reductase
MEKTMLPTPEGTSPFRVAIIGSGPAGIYAAEALTTQKDLAVRVDVFDQLCTPYGLVRYGVAPDHQKIKSVVTVLQRILQRPQVRFLGGVEYGRDLTHADVVKYYDAVIYAVGASLDRVLAIPGESLPGSLSATEFVAWYNGHPERATWLMPPPPPGVAVIGVGNVAVDVARVLAKTVTDLAGTDIASYALDTLAQSQVTDIYVLGRRGPAQARFTTKELKDLGELAAAEIIVRPEEVALSPAEVAAIADTTVRRNVEVLQQFSARPTGGKPRRIHLRFLVSPVEIVGTDRVEGLRIERNRLDEREQAVGTGEYETLPVQMVFRAVGYKGQPVADVPFDARRGIVPNEAGRVFSDGTILPGEYVTGWIKRGPTGVIGTNKTCAVETVSQLLRDAPTLPRAPQSDPAAVTALLEERGVPYVTFDQWLKLDQYEQELGKAQDRVRVKLYSREAMLRVMARAGVLV